MSQTPKLQGDIDVSFRIGSGWIECQGSGSNNGCGHLSWSYDSLRGIAFHNRANVQGVLSFVGNVYSQGSVDRIV